MGSQPKLLVIVGPTATGKSELALQIAKTHDGEIICADSRTVYKGMDIGTAKPSPADTKKIPHWGLNLVKPGQRFTVAQFLEYAQQKISDMNGRDKLAILVGGTGLYIDAILFSYEFRPDIDLKLRSKLEKMSVEDLQEIVKAKNYPMPANSKNPRHLIRTIETKGSIVSSERKIQPGVIVVGLMPPENILKDRIAKRAQIMFASGVIEETAGLVSKYGYKAIKSSGGLVYAICQRIIKGEISKEEALELVKIADWQYARRQRTWFKRNEQIKWFKDNPKAREYIEKLF